MTELVAEVGLAHEGSLGIAHSYIDLAASINIDTIKFQMHFADQESSEFENFRINFSYEDKNRFDYWSRTSFSIDEWRQLIKHAETKKLNFLISPFSLKAIDEINKLGLKRLKLGSAEVIDDLIINRSLDYDFEYIISNGFSGDSILDVIELFKRKKKKLTVLECTSKYPSSNKDFNYKRFKSLQKIRDLQVGVSDHSGDTSIIKYAISLGANIIEAHIAFDKRIFGPDSMSSLEPRQWEEIVQYRNDVNEITSDDYYKLDNKMKKTFSRSISFNKNLHKDSYLTMYDLESKKANGIGISTKLYKNYLGRKLLSDVKEGDFLKETDFKKDD